MSLILIKIAVVFFFGWLYHEKPADIIQLNDKREIFVDKFLIEELRGVRIIKHTPRDEGPVLLL